MAVRTRRIEADTQITIRRLAQTRRLLAASPDYLERHGTPERPEDLARHRLILYTLADDWNELRFRKGTETITVPIDGNAERERRTADPRRRPRRPRDSRAAHVHHP